MKQTTLGSTDWALLEEKQLLLKSRTIVDATIAAAPPSTKSAAKERTPR